MSCWGCSAANGTPHEPGCKYADEVVGMLGVKAEPKPAEKSPPEWKQWRRVTWSGRSGFLGYEIRVLIDRAPTNGDEFVLYDACDILECGISDESARLDPATAEGALRIKNSISGSFVAAGFDPIYMEEIPNEYDTRSARRLASPWFIVTTKIGHFKVGWRKSVIVLDWAKTTSPPPARDVFPSEDVTKGDFDIHCWGYPKLIEYLTKLAGAKR